MWDGSLPRVHIAANEGFPLGDNGIGRAEHYGGSHYVNQQIEVVMPCIYGISDIRVRRLP